MYGINKIRVKKEAKCIKKTTDKIRMLQTKHKGTGKTLHKTDKIGVQDRRNNPIQVF